jgi:hypothetical protein
MNVCDALLKYGYSNFSRGGVAVPPSAFKKIFDFFSGGRGLFIIEYCCEAPNNCLIREQYYLDTLLPEYNFLQKANSSLVGIGLLLNIQMKLKP